MRHDYIAVLVVCAMIGSGGFSRASTDLTEMDPLFYRGRTPVLGQPVEVKTGGELPGEFPAAGAPATGQGTAPRPPSPPRRPQFPAFPSFPGFPGFELTESPGAPGAGPTFGPTPELAGAPWWQSALAAGQTALKGYRSAQQLGRNGWNPAELGPNDWWVSGLGGELAGEGFGVVPGTGQIESFGGGEMGFVPGSTPPGPNFGQAVGPGLQAAGGVYSMLTAPELRSRQFAMGAANTVGGAAGVAAAMAPQALGALAALGPATALVSLPLIAGGIYEQFFAADRARFPQGWQVIPTASPDGGAINPLAPGARAVDPRTGAIVIYRGRGSYELAPETQRGQRATPQQFQDWMIDPAGDLLNLPGYAGIVTINRDRDILRTSPGSAEYTPGYRPSQARQQSALQEFRQPDIAQIQQATPGISEAEAWRRYTLTPRYLEEQRLREQMNPAYGPDR